MGSYNNWDIIDLTPKSIPFAAFDEIYKVVLDRIIENMAILIQSFMYGAINTYETTTNLFFAIQLISEEYTLQNKTTNNGQNISAGELVVKAQYL